MLKTGTVQRPKLPFEPPSSQKVIEATNTASLGGRRVSFDAEENTGRRRSQSFTLTDEAAQDLFERATRPVTPPPTDQASASKHTELTPLVKQLNVRNLRREDGDFDLPLLNMDPFANSASASLQSQRERDLMQALAGIVPEDQQEEDNDADIPETPSTPPSSKVPKYTKKQHSPDQVKKKEQVLEVEEGAVAAASASSEDDGLKRKVRTTPVKKAPAQIKPKKRVFNAQNVIDIFFRTGSPFLEKFVSNIMFSGPQAQFSHIEGLRAGATSFEIRDRLVAPHFETWGRARDLVSTNVVSLKNNREVREFLQLLLLEETGQRPLTPNAEAFLTNIADKFGRPHYWEVAAAAAAPAEPETTARDRFIAIREANLAKVGQEEFDSKHFIKMDLSDFTFYVEEILNQGLGYDFEEYSTSDFRFVPGVSPKSSRIFYSKVNKWIITPDMDAHGGTIAKRYEKNSKGLWARAGSTNARLVIVRP